jgi:catechol 2,3-dioxygenase-like lactoylglutathione lyase family enzyme
MFDHAGIVVLNLARSAKLYAAMLEPLGLQIHEEHRTGANEGWLVISRGKPHEPFFVLSGGRPSFWRADSEAGRSPVHLCFTAPSKEAVDRFHAAGLEHGAKDNGAPGIRRQPYYDAFLLDFDSNNIEAGIYLQSPNG